MRTSGRWSSPGTNPRRRPAAGAVVTASGTGAEMNGGAGITNEALKLKTGMGAFAPRFAVLDPKYTLSVPRMQVISGAFDTLSHAMETLPRPVRPGTMSRTTSPSRLCGTPSSTSAACFRTSTISRPGGT